MFCVTSVSDLYYCVFTYLLIRVTSRSLLYEHAACFTAFIKFIKQLHTHLQHLLKAFCLTEDAITISVYKQ